LSRKDQVDTQEDNKDVKMLKEELMIRRTTTEIAMLKKYKSLEDSNLLEEIRRNNTREQKVEQELKKENSLVWEQDCCGNHLSQRQMITQVVNLLSWISSGKFIREFDKESLLN